MNNKFERKNKLYESEDTIPTFDADIDVLELLHDATIMGLDDEENEIPGYVFADELADLIGMSTEELVEFAKENGYDIYTAHVNGEELPADLFVICAKGCDTEVIKSDYKEIYEVEIELRPLEPKEDESEDSESIEEAYVSPSDEKVEEFKNLLKSNGYEISSSEKYRSLFGDDKSYSVHLQIVSKDSGFTRETFEKEFERISEKIQEFDPNRRFHITYNFGLMKSEFITAGLDVRPEEIEENKEEDDEDRYSDEYGDDFDDEYDSDEEDDELNEENELQKTARRHKKTDKKGSKGAFVNPNAGDVEKNVAFFNKALGNEASTADGGIGEVFMGESLKQFELVKLEGETRQKFVERFMKDKEEKFPKPKERYQSALECWEKQK